MSGNPEAWSFPQGVAASRKAKEKQEESEQARRDASRDLAECEQAYRLALAQKIVTLTAEGAPATVAKDRARGDKEVAHLGYLRDVAKGVLDAEETRAWRHTADRKDVNEFIIWSRLVAPMGEQSEPVGRGA